MGHIVGMGGLPIEPPKKNVMSGMCALIIRTIGGWLTKGRLGLAKDRLGLTKR